MIYIKKNGEISKEEVAEVGGKAASLGELVKIGLPVPPFFVVITKAYKQFSKQKISIVLEEEILKAFDSLDAERVAVRSSAIAEDSLESSWAGQLETYLNVKKENLISKIRGCWDSIKSKRVLSYTSKQYLSKDQLAVAVVIQKMIDSEISGVMFTVNPITKDKGEIMIEAGFGLGELLVQGLITPDNFIVNKKTLRISRNIQTKEIMLMFKGGMNKKVAVTEDKRNKPALSDNQIKELTRLAIKIENHFNYPQDIEWAFEKGKFYITQSRPITIL